MNIKRISSGPIARPCRSQSVEEVVRSVFYLLLAALIAADLTRTAFNASRFFRAPDLLAGIYPLDSFSEPATAAAILKRQAESLLLDYTEARNAASEVAPSRVQGPGQVGNPKQAVREYAGFAGFDRGSPPEVSRIQPLEKLHATMRDMTIDLDQKLLVIFSENHFENQLLDRFLQFLHEAPEQPEVLEWVSCALDYSRRCGRTEELEDALRHVVRFHPELKTARQLTALLDSWESKQDRDLGADH
jgi:hypothetical protein